MSEAKFVIVIPAPLTFWRGLLHVLTNGSAWTNKHEEAETFTRREDAEHELTRLKNTLVLVREGSPTYHYLKGIAAAEVQELN